MVLSVLGYINRRSLHISKRENCAAGLEIILVIICSLQIRTHTHTHAYFNTHKRQHLLGIN